MNKGKITGLLISIFITMPIWFYLLYKVLEAVGASELMWFLYWVYVPSAFFSAFILKALEDK